MIKFFITTYLITLSFLCFSLFSTDSTNLQIGHLSEEYVRLKLQMLRNALFSYKLEGVQRIPEVKSQISESQISDKRKEILYDYLDSIRSNYRLVSNSRKATRVFRNLENPQKNFPLFVEVERQIVEANKILYHLGLPICEEIFPHALRENLENLFEEFKFQNFEAGEKVANFSVRKGAFGLYNALLFPEIELYLMHEETSDATFINQLMRKNILPEAMASITILGAGEEGLSLVGGSFDHLVMRNDLHHYRNADKVLQTLSKSLVAEGSIIVIENVKDHPENPASCNKAFTIGELLKKLQANQYERLRMELGNKVIMIEAKPRKQ